MSKRIVKIEVDRIEGNDIRTLRAERRFFDAPFSRVRALSGHPVRIRQRDRPGNLEHQRSEASYVLAGPVIVVDGLEGAIAVETRHIEKRGIEQPETEQVIRGARRVYRNAICRSAGSAFC
jgi:hypothetical protein